MGSNLKWEKHNKLEIARDFRQSDRRYLYSDIELMTTKKLDNKQKKALKLRTQQAEDELDVLVHNETSEEGD